MKTEESTKTGETEGVACKHCGTLPNLVKHCFDNMAYYNFRCKCKETPLLRSYDSAETAWETKYFETSPDKMPTIKSKSGEYLI